MNLSIIIILYKSKHLVDSIIDNISNKIPPVWEIIFINNSLENIDIDQENIRIIYPGRNLGYGAAINLGVKYAKYESLLIINPDLNIESFIPVLSENNYGLIGGYMLNNRYINCYPPIFQDTMRLTLRRIMPWKRLDFILNTPKRKLKNNVESVDYFSGSLLYTNKKTFEKIGGFDENIFLFYEEIDFCRRANWLNIPVYIDSAIAYHHEKKIKSSIGDVRPIKINAEIKSFAYYHKKYSGKTKTTLAICFVYLFALVMCLIFSFASIIVPHKYIISRKLTFYYYIKRVNVNDMD